MRGLFAIHSAVFLFGLPGVLSAFINVPPAMIVLGRTAFATLSLGIIFLISGKRFPFHTGRDILFLSAPGIILAAHWLCFFYSIRISSVSLALLTYATFPMFVTVLEPALFHEERRAIDWVAALLIFLGFLMVVPEWNADSRWMRGAFWGLLSGFTFAVLMLLNRSLLNRYKTLEITFVQNTGAMMVLIPALFFHHVGLSGTDTGLLAIMGVVCTALAFYLFIRGLKTVTTQLASIIACLEPVYGVLLAWTFLGERLDLKTALGGLIILGTTVLATVNRKKA